MRLNQKIAPELYLEVLTICKHDNKFAFGDEGEIVEYTLKMRAFPQSNRFDKLLEAGKLQSDRLTELGILLAKEGYLVILDAKYDRAERRQKVISRAKAASIPLQIVYCTAPLSVLRDRFDYLFFFLRIVLKLLFFTKHSYSLHYWDALDRLC